METFTLLEFDRCFSFISIGHERSLNIIIHLLVLVIGTVDRSSGSVERTHFLFNVQYTSTVIFGHIIHVLLKVCIIYAFIEFH